MTQIIKSNNGGGGGTGGEAKRGEISGNILTQTDLVEELDKRVEASELSTVAFSGEFGDLKNIPDETDPVFMASAASNIDASDITNWNGKYTKPTTGIPKTDLSTDVKSSLGKADTAVQPNVLNSFATLVDLANGLRDKQDKALVTTLDNADDEHYPSAKAVADAMSGAGLGDMMKAVYDPTNKNADAFDAQNQYNLDTELSNTSEKAVQNKVITAKINDIELSKAPNVSIVGEPTITQGNISGFSISNYLIAPFLSSFAGYPFTFHMDITTGSNVTTQQNILDSSYGLAFAISGGKFVIALSTNGTSWDLGSHTGTYAVKANTSYCIEIEWTGSNYILRVSTDRVNFTTDITVAGASALSGSTLYIGGHGEVDHPFGGTINLNEWQFLSGTIVVWKGMDDAGLATRANLSLSNLNVQGEERLNNLVDSYFLKEDVDYTVSFNATKGVAPYSTSYGYTEITITNPLIKEKLGATYQFSINTKPATSTYRNVRVRFGESGEWYGLGANNSVSAQYTRFTKTYPCIFVFKEQSSSSTTAKYFSEVYVNTTYSAMTAAEAQTGTATSGRTMTAKVLADEITRREGLYHDATKQDVISDLEDIRSNADDGAAAKNTVDTHVANGTIHVTASDKVAWSQKQNAIADLENIRSGASKGATALQPSDVGAAAKSNSYNDLDNKPTIPTVYNSTITIQKGGTTVNSFTLNSSSAKTVNIPNELPSGGTEGQVLTKKANGTTSWEKVNALPEGGTTGQVLTKKSDGTAEWANASGGVQSTTIKYIVTATSLPTTPSTDTFYVITS